MGRPGESGMPGLRVSNTKATTAMISQAQMNATKSLQTSIYFIYILLIFKNNLNLIWYCSLCQ